jgi:protein-disulfide isomerase-like protein with CxxC motif
MPSSNHLEILAFTDPVCTWCWGSEPVLRKLEAVYGDQIRIRYVMGGLVENIRNFYDSANNIGGDPEQVNGQVARHWLEASERHGMPVRTDGFRLFSADVLSTYPQNIAFKAVELTDADKAPAFLRRVREASAAEARETGRTEVLVELATEVGINLETLLQHLNDGSAEEAFRKDLSFTRQYAVRGFPTFLLRYEGRELLLRGYQRFGGFKGAIDMLTGEVLSQKQPDPSQQGILEFIQGHGRVAPIEIDTAFGLSSDQRETITQALIGSGLIRWESAGNGGFFMAASTSQVCDADTGVCLI